ncbi:hypothetical protein D3C85_734630 [compost metagenome]
MRPAAQARPSGTGRAVPLVQPPVRAADRRLHQRRALLPQALGSGPAAVRSDDRAAGRTVRPSAQLPGAQRRPGLRDQCLLPAAGCLADPYREAHQRSDPAADGAPGGRGRGDLRRFRRAHLRHPQQCRGVLRAAQGLERTDHGGAGCAQPDPRIHGPGRAAEGRRGDDLQPAADHRHEHHRRLRGLYPGPQRRRHPGIGGQGRGIPRGRGPAPGTGRGAEHLQRQRAAVLHRPRPHQGARPRRVGQRRVHRHAGDLRQLLRQRLQPVRAHLPGQPAIGVGVQAQAGRPVPGLCARRRRRAGALVDPGQGRAHPRPGQLCALQRLSGGEDPRRPGAWLQFRASPGGGTGGGRRDPRH